MPPSFPHNKSHSPSMINTDFKMLQNSAIAIVFRFPFAIALSLLLTATLLVVGSLKNVEQEKFPILCFAGMFLFVSVGLIRESRKLNPWVINTLGSAIFAAMWIYFYSQPSLVPLFLICMGLLFFALVAPFITKNASKEALWKFNYRLWSGVLFSIFATLVISFGIAFLLVSLEYLFSITVVSHQYEKIAIIMGCFFLPFVAMSYIPKEFDARPQDSEAKGIEALLEYAMSPILLVFGLIIICYALEIAALQNLPRGKVSYLVAGLGGVGFLTYLLGENGRSAKSLPHRMFRKYFFLLLIIPLILMGIGIGVRIQEYGVTELRYLDALILVWMSVCVIYSVFCSRESLGRFILASAAILLVCSSFGPWGMVDASSRSQFNRLQTLLESNQILVDGKINKNHPPISTSDAYKIEDSVKFLMKRKKDAWLQRWSESTSPATSPSEWTNLRKKVSNPFDEISRTVSISHTQEKNAVVDIKGFDFVIPKMHLGQPYAIPNSDLTILAAFDEKAQELLLKKMGIPKPLLIIPIKELVSRDEKDINDRLLIYDKAEGPIKVRLVIQNLQGSMRNDASFVIGSIQLMLLVKQGN